MAFRIPGVWGSNPNSLAKPKISRDLETSIKGVFVAGDLGGSPVIRTAVNQGVHVARTVQTRCGGGGAADGTFDLVIVGAGAAGLSASLEAKRLGLTCVLLEKREWAATIQDFSKGKQVFAEPRSLANESSLWIDEDTSKEDLLERWRNTLETSELDLREGEEVSDVRREGGAFVVQATSGPVRGRFVLLSMGTRGNPRRTGAKGEELLKVHHKLMEPSDFVDRRVLVIGGGDSALETAFSLCMTNEVSISYRGDSFNRAKSKNIKRVERAIAEGHISVHWGSTLRYIDEGQVCVALKDGEEVCFPNDEVFVQIGAELPVRFLRKVGLEFEGDRNGGWWGRIAIAFGLSVAYYTIAKERGVNIWTFLGLDTVYGNVIEWMRSDHYLWTTSSGGKYVKFGGTVFFGSLIYTLVILGFGFQAMRRWWKAPLQRWRYASLMFFQCFFFLILPEIIWRNASFVTPELRGQFSQAYGILYAWPLSIYSIVGAPVTWLVYGLLLTFVAFPIYVRWFGKSFCTWICACGGLAETLGDRWRHLAPKGKLAHRLERMNWGVLLFATFVTLTWLLTRFTNWDGALVRDMNGDTALGSDGLLHAYKVVVDWLMIGVIPISLYPAFGGKIWCRMWCPLAKYMELLSGWFGKLKIDANDKCISCNECSRYCQVGIDVMMFAQRQEAFDNSNTACIQCGICVAVCPVEVLTFTSDDDVKVTLDYD